MPTLPKRTRRIKRKAEYRSGRPQADAGFYNKTTWRTFSRLYKEQHPLCEQCKRQGKTTASQVTDHIIPLQHGGAIWDERNLQSLCKVHHDQKNGMERHGMILRSINTPNGKIPKGEG